MNKGRVIRLALAGILLCAALALIVPLCIRFATEPYIFTSVQDVPSAQVAVVPGASIVHGEPSPVLQDRADAAIALYDAHKVQRILVSGDNGQSDYDEVTPVRKYLIAHGVPAKDIFLDHAGFDTYSSMYRAVHVFEANSMIVVTQDFHMPRALFTARHLGAQAYGLVAAGETSSVQSYMREIPATFKALFDLYTQREPQYRGGPYPLTGVGTTTWF